MRIKDQRMKPKGFSFSLLFAVGCLLLSASFLLVGEAQACPMCSEALSAQGDTPSATKLTQGYARSIALLMGAPYLLFAGVATWIVRSTRHNKRSI